MKRTVNNLMIGFIRESQTRIRYEIYAEIAKSEKFILISRTFRDLAIQKFSNANLFYEMLQQVKKEEFFESLTVEIKSPTTYSTTVQNIESSIKEEDEEWQNLYPNYASIAETEGYQHIAKKIRKFAQVKRNHSQRFRMLRDLINSNAFSTKNAVTFWKCMSCGYEVPNNELSDDYICPSCGHFKAYFQRKSLLLIPEEKSLEHRDVSGWVCMECGYEAPLEELPDDWKCVSCGRSKAYFKRKILKHKDDIIYSTGREKAHWVCLECGNEEEIDMPFGWKCPKCGFPQHNSSD